MKKQPKKTAPVAATAPIVPRPLVERFTDLLESHLKRATEKSSVMPADLHSLTWATEEVMYYLTLRRELSGVLDELKKRREAGKPFLLYLHHLHTYYTNAIIRRTMYQRSTSVMHTLSHIKEQEVIQFMLATITEFMTDYNIPDAKTAECVKMLEELMDWAKSIEGMTVSHGITNTQDSIFTATRALIKKCSSTVK